MKSFKVKEVYYKTDISSLPNYIKNIVSSKRNKHIDSLIKLSSEVRNWLCEHFFNQHSGWADDIQCLGGRLCHSQHLLWTWDCDWWDQSIQWISIFPLKELERGISMGPVEFVSSLGGLFGLFLGFSLVSFLEIIYWATVRICRNLIWRHNAGLYWAERMRH